MLNLVVCITLSVVFYLNVRFSRLITSVEEERAGVFVTSIAHCFVSVLPGGVPLPLGAWERRRYFIMTLPGPSITKWFVCVWESQHDFGSFSFCYCHLLLNAC